MHGRALFIVLMMLGCWPFCWAQSTGSSLAEIKVAAEAGDPIAQDKLAERFILRGDTKQAEFWYRKAAEQGYARAQGKLGNMLLMRCRMGFSGTAAQRMAVGEEAVRWVTLAANQGDKRGQADLADIYLDGKLVKPDLIEAYKWGDLAAQGLMLDPARITGSARRDAAILQMSSDQIAEAKKRVAAFKPHKAGKDEWPEPSWVGQIKLSGLSGPADRRLALINGKTFSPSETGSVKVAGKTVKVRCLEIREKSTLVEIEGLKKPLELFLEDAKP
jgi:hypothetical protein